MRVCVRVCVWVCVCVCVCQRGRERVEEGEGERERERRRGTTSSPARPGWTRGSPARQADTRSVASAGIRGVPREEATRGARGGEAGDKERVEGGRVEGRGGGSGSTGEGGGAPVTGF